MDKRGQTGSAGGRMRVISPAPREAWTAVLSASTEALAFHSPAWLDCLCDAGGYRDASRLYELESGRQLLVPMVRPGFLPASLVLEASLPFGWGFGGVMTRGSVTAADVAAVLTDLGQQPVLSTSLRPNPLTAAAWAAAAPPGLARVPRSAHVLELDGSFEHVWGSRVTSSARKQARRAERAGVTVERDTSGALVPAFYELYLRSAARWARLRGQHSHVAIGRAQRREPLCKFQRVAARLGEACRVWVAWLHGRPAAASIVLMHGNSANDWRGAMDEEIAGPSQANYLLHHYSIQDACQAGCRYYHMGETGASVSLAFFKGRFGARVYDYQEYHVERLPITRAVMRLRSLRQWLERFAVHNDHPNEAPEPCR